MQILNPRINKSIIIIIVIIISTYEWKARRKYYNKRNATREIDNV